MWDVEYWDADTQTGYRIRTRSLRVRDAVAVDSEQDQIANTREDVSGRAFMALLDWPLLRHGTAASECVVLPNFTADTALDPVFPDDAIWHPFELDEARFNDLPETLFWSWYAAIIQRNPHRDRRYDLLKKRLKQEPPATENAPSTSVNGTGDSMPVMTSPAS